MPNGGEKLQPQGAKPRAAAKIKKAIHAEPNFRSALTASSPRAVGDAVQPIRKSWSLCAAVREFYPAEIAKTQDRIGRFNAVQSYWRNQPDIWA